MNNVAVFSMWPLLRRDGLAVQYIAVLLLWNRLIGYNPFRIKERSLVQLASVAIYLAALGLHALELVVPPPARYPDLFPVLNVLISTPVFASVWLWSIWNTVKVSWAIGGLSSSSKRVDSSPTAMTPTEGLGVENAGRRLRKTRSFASSQRRGSLEPVGETRE